MNFMEHKLEQIPNCNLTKLEDPHENQLRLMFLFKYGNLLFCLLSTTTLETRSNVEKDWVWPLSRLISPNKLLK